MNTTGSCLRGSATTPPQASTGPGCVVAIRRTSIDGVTSAGGGHAAPQSCQSIAIDADSSSELATCRASAKSAGETGVCRITSACRVMASSRAGTPATLTFNAGSDQIFTVLYGALPGVVFAIQISDAARA